MFRTPESKFVPFNLLNSAAELLHAEGLKIVSTNGCFDFLHWGHIHYLNEARALGDILFCGVNSDRSVKHLKGEGRPLCAEKERALQLASLEVVDFVTIFDEETPERFLEILRPAIHTKGGDYDGKILPEAGVVERAGGIIKFLPFTVGYSTTKIIEKIRHCEP
jgi:rfaE bifunctional protein nucleotidyltransferase chain/domain